MKRVLLFVVTTFFLVVIAQTSFAAETTFSGTYRIRSYSEYNFDKKAGYSPPDYESQYDGWFEQKFTLKITHSRSKYLKAVIRLDLVEDTWGQGRDLRINDDTSDFIGRAYLELRLPEIGRLRAGLFNEKLGRGLLLSSSDITGIRWYNKWDAIRLYILYAKINDNVTSTTPRRYNRDTDLVSLELKITPVKKHRIELFGGVAFDNTGALLTESYFWQLWRPNTNRNDIDATIGFLGVSYTGIFADMLDVKVEYDRIIGSARMNDYFIPSRGGVTYDGNPSVEGWNIYADVSYYNELFRVGLAFVMGSGAKHYWGPGQVENINLNYIVDSGFKWGSIIGGGSGGNNSVYDGGALGFDNGIENLTSAKLYFNMYPTDKLKIKTSFIWGKWTNPVGGTPATGGKSNLAYPHPADWYSNYNWSSWEASTDLGYELDLRISYEIMKGLTYSFSSGVLFTGDSWDYQNNDGTREKWGTIFSITNTIQYRF